MPTYEPHVWNATPQKIWENNCYNYATNIQKNWHPPLLNGALPGAAHGQSICWPVQVPVGPSGGPEEMCDNKCDREPGDPPANQPGPRTIMEACKADGLKDPVNGQCADGCWLVAVYARRLNVAQQLFADFHFVRQDTLPNGTKKWSHKPGDGPVTDQKYVESNPPGNGKFNGGPITDPATDNVGIGPYKFCGYLCCCPHEVTIATHVPEEREEYAMVQYGGTSGMASYRLLEHAPDEILSMVHAVQGQAESPWQEGMTDGNQLFYISLSSTRSPAGISILENATILWDPKPRYFLDPKGATAALFKELVGWWSPYSE